MNKYLISYFYQLPLGDFGVMTNTIERPADMKKAEIIKNTDERIRLELASKFNADMAEKAKITIIAICEL